MVAKHCANKGYVLDGPKTDKHGYLDFEVSIANPEARVGLSFNGEVSRGRPGVS
ncbi:MAG: hypothetical protein ACLGIV_05020 [Actinomycetes bacterium]